MARIVHLANMYSPVSGGLRTAIHALGESYLTLGQDFVVIVPGKKFKKTRTSYGIKYELPSIPIPFTGGYRIIVRLRLVKRILKQYSPTVVEISDRLTLVPIARWAKAQEIPTVLFAHERVDGVLKAFGPRFISAVRIADFWNRITAKWFTHLVATTNYAADEFHRLGLMPQIVPLGVDLSRFSPRLRNSTLKRDFGISGNLIFAMTRLSREKDPEFIIDIARQLKSERSDDMILVAGHGPMLSSLRSIADEENLPVQFLGHLSDRVEVASLLANADVFVAVGPIETFGLAALESLASGVPVICRDSGAIQEIIDINCGTPLPRDAKKWLEEIVIWSGKDAELKADLARNRAEQFSWHTCANTLLNLYGVNDKQVKAA